MYNGVVPNTCWPIAAANLLMLQHCWHVCSQSHKKRCSKSQEQMSAVAAAEVTVDRPEDRQNPAEQEAVSLSLQERLMTATGKIVDFGNGCWTHKHFTDDIQTRQYRCPEVSSLQLAATLLGQAGPGPD